MKLQYGPGLVEDLLAAFPQVRTLMTPHYQESANLPHVIYASVFVQQYVQPLLGDPDHHSSALRDVFSFIERLARDGDERVRELIADSVLESFGDTAESHYELLARAKPLMGPHTLQILAGMEP